MRLAARAVLALIWVLIIGTVLAGASWAQTLMPQGTPIDKDTTCGALATGLSRVTRDIVRMKMPNNKVDADGYWAACDRPCGGSQRFMEWTVDGHTCSSADRLATSPTDPRRMQGRLHGESEAFSATSGPTRGRAVYTCNDGAYRLTEATCGPAPPARPCDLPIDVKVGKCRFQYTGKGVEGDTIAIRPRPGQGDMRSVCFGGLWLTTSLYCASR